MKKYISYLAVLMLMVSCLGKGRDINFNIVAGTGLYLPEDGSRSDLTKGRPVSFEWGPAMAEDNGYVLYEVLFDKVGGDFSAPVGRVAAQAGGSRNYVSIPAKTLNSFARAAGIASDSEGSLQWSVRASKGIGGVIYPSARQMVLHTMNSMDPLPVSLTLQGSAMEDVTRAVPSQGIDKSGRQEGVFETFGRMQAGGNFQVKDNLGRYYVLNADGTLSASASAVDNSLSGDTRICWLQMDFTAMLWSVRDVEKIEYYAACWADNQATTDRQTMVYQGKGVWKLSDYPNTISDNTAGDSRHRFDMKLADGSTVYLGTEALLGPAYTTDYLRVHFYTPENMKDSFWGVCWNYLPADCGRPLDVILHLNADNEAGSWWHEYQFK